MNSPAEGTTLSRGRSAPPSARRTTASSSPSTWNPGTSRWTRTSTRRWPGCTIGCQGPRSGSSGPDTRPRTACEAAGDPRYRYRQSGAGRPPPSSWTGWGGSGCRPGGGHRRFTGALVLPAALVAALGLPWRSGGTAVLADGSTQQTDYYEAE